MLFKCVTSQKFSRIYNNILTQIAIELKVNRYLFVYQLLLIFFLHVFEAIGSTFDKNSDCIYSTIFVKQSRIY